MIWRDHCFERLRLAETNFAIRKDIQLARRIRGKRA